MSQYAAVLNASTVCMHASIHPYVHTYIVIPWSYLRTSMHATSHLARPSKENKRVLQESQERCLMGLRTQSIFTVFQGHIFRTLGFL